MAPRRRKRFIVIAPRYTFRGAKPCICTENEALIILQKERHLYRKIMDGPATKEQEHAQYYTLVGIALLKVKQSDGRFLTRDMVSNSEYYNERLPPKDFKPIYIQGNKADFYLPKEDRDPQLQTCVNALCKINELSHDESMESDENLFSVIKFLNMTSKIKDIQIKEIRKELKKKLVEFKEKGSPAEIALISMVV